MDAQVPSNPNGNDKTASFEFNPAQVSTPTQVLPIDMLSQVKSQRSFGDALANAAGLDPSNQGIGAVPADQMVQNIAHGQPAVPVAAPNRGLAAVFGAATPAAPVAPAAAAPAAGAAAPALPQSPVDPAAAHQALEQAYGVKPMGDDDAFVAAHLGKISYRQLEHLNSMLPLPRTAADEAGHSLIATHQAALQSTFKAAQDAQNLFEATGGHIDPATGVAVGGSAITKKAFEDNKAAHVRQQGEYYKQMLALTNPMAENMQYMQQKMLADAAAKR